MSKVKLFFLSVFILLLTACSHFTDSNRISPPPDNKNIPPLKVPSDMDISFDTLYPIPQRNYPSEVKPVDISPPTLYASRDAGRGWFSW